MSNQQKNAKTSFYWQMWCSSFGQVFCSNGKGATSLMELVMYQHVCRSWLGNPPSVAWPTYKKSNSKSGERAPWKNDNILQTSSQGSVATRP
jgi:hypothetical protein